MNPSPGHVFDIIKWLADTKSVPAITAVAQELGMPVSAAHRSVALTG